VSCVSVSVISISISIVDLNNQRLTRTTHATQSIRHRDVIGVYSQLGYFSAPHRLVPLHHGLIDGDVSGTVQPGANQHRPNGVPRVGRRIEAVTRNTGEILGTPIDLIKRLSRLATFPEPSLLEKLDAIGIDGLVPHFGHSSQLIGPQRGNRDHRRYHHADLQRVRPYHRSNTTLVKHQTRSQGRIALPERRKKVQVDPPV